MSDTKSAGQQLADAIKALETAAAQVEALKQQTRDEDLATVKRLITTHGFTPTDLRGILKAKTASRAPRKSTSRRKTK